MKGKLVNKEGKWYVQYWEQLLPPNENKKVHNEKPLDPNTNPFGFNYNSGDNVEFEIVNDYEEPNGDIQYAKLINKQEETNTWDEIFNEMKESQREDYYGFLNYLKENYSVPVKLKK